jgi:hypothetical protein
MAGSSLFVYFACFVVNPPELGFRSAIPFTTDNADDTDLILTARPAKHAKVGFVCKLIGAKVVLQSVAQEVMFVS